MKKQDLIGLSILILLVIIMSIPLFTFDWKKTGGAIGGFNCGNCSIDCESDFDCFVNASYNCSYAYMVNRSTVNFLGALISATNIMEIKGYESDQCIYFQQLINSSVEFSQESIEQMLMDEMTLEEIDELLEHMNKNSRLMAGAEIICKFDVAKLTDTLIRWKSGNFADDVFFCDIADNKWQCSSYGIFEECEIIPPSPRCGNNICESNETFENCQQDCNIIYCNNNLICETFENRTTCPSDCECEIGENMTCSTDVGICEPGIQFCNLTGTMSGKWSQCFEAILPINETCNGLDDDCDGEVDEGLDLNNNSKIDPDERFDFDMDDYFPQITMQGFNCTGYDEYDCDDTEERIYPYAEERLNDMDDDCDGLIDEDINEIDETQMGNKINIGTISEDGSNAYLREGDWAIFRVKDISGKIEVKNIQASSTVLMVSSVDNLRQLPEIQISLNEIKQFDIDLNGKDDISVQLQNIQSSFKTYLLVKDISELLAPQICNNDNVCEPGENQENCPNDCKPIILCNNNGLCEQPLETEQTCPNDCIPVQIKQPEIEQPKRVIIQECNNNGICEEWEAKENCPNDCNIHPSRNLVWIIVLVIIASGLLSGTLFVRSKSGSYKLNNNLKKKVIRSLDLGYNLKNIHLYLQSQKINPEKIRLAERYSKDFMALKSAIIFYIAQEKPEKDIREMCKKNNWASSIVNEVFEDIKNQQKKMVFSKKPKKPIQQKYNIKF